MNFLYTRAYQSLEITLNFFGSLRGSLTGIGGTTLFTMLGIKEILTLLNLSLGTIIAILTIIAQLRKLNKIEGKKVEK